jgi:hypothetical protein
VEHLSTLVAKRSSTLVAKRSYTLVAKRGSARMQVMEKLK